MKWIEYFGLLVFVCQNVKLAPDKGFHTIVNGARGSACDNASAKFSVR